jgi:hypothetical protein
MKSRYLKPGERFTMDDGTMWEVERVNQCAATIRQIHVVPTQVLLPSGREFLARKGKRTTISPTALVQRV